jgi:hypothetical protein
MTVHIRCKMICHGVESSDNNPDNPMSRVSFGAVYSNNPATEDFVYGKYTPYGNFQANIITSTAEKLVVGQAYYIDIVPVGAPGVDEEESE